MASLPAYYGTTFTPTTHSRIPPNLIPSTNPLPTPCAVIVTGAGKGLGYHIALAYAHAHCTALSISSRTPSDLNALEKALLAINPNLHILKSTCDTQSDESVARLAQDVEKAWGRVDVVVANAGVISRYITRESDSGGGSNLPMGILEDDDWARVLDINLLGTWRVARAFMPLLIATRDGPQTLICSTSLAAHSVSSAVCPIAYNVSKAACNRLIEHVANDHGKDGVRAFALHPGAVVTPQTVGHRGEVWESEGVLRDDEGLAGAMCVWLSQGERGWLSGRYVSCNWDVGELVGRREEIVERDLLKFRMEV